MLIAFFQNLNTVSLTSFQKTYKDFFMIQNRQQAAQHGFTLIELVVTVGIAAVLSAIALPSFSESIKKQKIRAAQTDLTSLVLMMENRYQQQLSYPAVTATTAATQTTFTGWSPAQAANFVYIIASVSNTAPATYTLSATGSGGLSGCTISIDQSNARTTSGCISGSTAWQ